MHGSLMGFNFDTVTTSKLKFLVPANITTCFRVNIGKVNKNAFPEDGVALLTTPSNFSGQWLGSSTKQTMEIRIIAS